MGERGVISEGKPWRSAACSRNKWLRVLGTQRHCSLLFRVNACMQEAAALDDVCCENHMGSRGSPPKSTSNLVKPDFCLEGTKYLWLQSLS